MSTALDFGADWPCQIDFMQHNGRVLIAYGWIADLWKSLSAADLLVGGRRHSVLDDAIAIPRPDVSSELRRQGMNPQGDFHGFFYIAEASVDAAAWSARLSLVSQAGRMFHSDWTVVTDLAEVNLSLRQNERQMRQFIDRLPPRQRDLLASVFTPPLQIRSADLAQLEVPGDSNLQLTSSSLLHPGCLLLTGSFLAGPERLRSLEIGDGREWHPALHQLVFTDAVLPAISALGNPLHHRATAQFCLTLTGPPGQGLLDPAADLTLRYAGFGFHGNVRVGAPGQPGDGLRRLKEAINLSQAATRVAILEPLLPYLLAPEAPGHDHARMVHEQLQASVAELPHALETDARFGNLRIVLENAIPVADVGLLVAGWANFEGETEGVAVEYVCGTTVVPVSAHWARRPRADVNSHLLAQGLASVRDAGFVCLVRHTAHDFLPYLRLTLGRRVWRLRIPVAQPSGSQLARIREILSLFSPEGSGLRHALDHHIGPCVQAVWSARPPAPAKGLLRRFGPVAAAPTVSLLVPLFGRHDLAELQLCLLSEDPDIHRAELIFVVDDPTLIDDFLRICPDLAATFGLSFTVAYPGRNLGYAGATNFGARAARAPLLLLLNSDVFPCAPGWLEALSAIYRSDPTAGILGVKLLYEDGSVQHAGMRSEPLAAWDGLWINQHPHKGLPPDTLTGVREAPAVTAACAMISNTLYQALGGLSEDYIIGDFEDSDLCYRVRRSGRSCKVALDVSLYHLERQSQGLGDDRWRLGLTLYNCWLHQQRWGAALEKGAL